MDPIHFSFHCLGGERTKKYLSIVKMLFIPALKNREASIFWCTQYIFWPILNVTQYSSLDDKSVLFWEAQPAQDKVIIIWFFSSRLRNNLLYKKNQKQSTIGDHLPITMLKSLEALHFIGQWAWEMNIIICHLSVLIFCLTCSSLPNHFQCTAVKSFYLTSK